MKFPKTIAAVQKRECCMWEIGDALLAECGPPSDGRKNGSYVKLEAAAAEIDHLKIEGYTVDYLAKLREVSHKFPSRTRNPAISWAAHRSSGSPEMLGAITKARASKPITNLVVRTTRKAIEDHQARKHRETSPRKPLPKKRDLPLPSQDEIKGLAIVAEMADWVMDLKRCDRAIVDISGKVEKNLPKLERADIDYLVEIAKTLADHSNQLASIALKLERNRRSHLQLVGA